MRRAAKKDWNQGAIVEALRAIGVVVFVVNQEGLPDLLTFDRRARALWDGNHYRWLPIEVKSPGGALTQAQKAMQRDAPYPIVESVVQALGLFGVEFRV